MATRQSALENMAMTTFWRDRPVFVTGATGLLGGWLVRHLSEQGAQLFSAKLAHAVSALPSPTNQIVRAKGEPVIADR